MADYARVRHGDLDLWALDRRGEILPLPSAPWITPLPVAGARPLASGAFSWLPPVAPTKILAMGRTFAAHARERGVEPPARPLVFFKPPSSLLAHGGDVVLPPESDHVEFEGELALVIGRRVRRFPADGDPRQVVFGCLVADDVSARDLQASEGQWARAKGFDTFCPVGPRLRSGLPPLEARLTTTVNGEIRQDAPLSAMRFTFAQLLAHASAAMTLMPGDVLLTGTPEGVGRLAPGDRACVRVGDLPALEHGVVAEAR